MALFPIEAFYQNTLTNIIRNYGLVHLVMTIVVEVVSNKILIVTYVYRKRVVISNGTTFIGANKSFTFIILVLHVTVEVVLLHDLNNSRCRSLILILLLSCFDLDIESIVTITKSTTILIFLLD